MMRVPLTLYVDLAILIVAGVTLLKSAITGRLKIRTGKKFATGVLFSRPERAVLAVIGAGLLCAAAGIAKYNFK